MKLKSCLMTLAVLLPLAGCAGMEAAGHKYFMRGQILEAEGNSIYLCIGSHDGAKVGQQLNVYKFGKVAAHPKPTSARFKRKLVGRVEITSITDEHMATAKIVSGQATRHDVVELVP